MAKNPDIPQGPRPDAGHVDSLEHPSSEQAAVALAELFRRTGSAQARVTDPAAVRRLVRLDCRVRGVAVRTHAAHGVVLGWDDARREVFLATPDGRVYEAEMQQRIVGVLTAVPPSPPRRLRVVKPATTPRRPDRRLVHSFKLTDPSARATPDTAGVEHGRCCGTSTVRPGAQAAIGPLAGPLSRPGRCRPAARHVRDAQPRGV